MKYCIFDKKNHNIVVDGFVSRNEAACVMCNIIQTRRALDEQNGLIPIPIDKPELVVLPNDQYIFEYIYAGNPNPEPKRNCRECKYGPGKSVFSVYCKKCGTLKEEEEI